MSSLRDFIYLETAFRCVSCSGTLKKYKDQLGNIYYVCNSCNKKYFATKKPKYRYIIDIGVILAVLLFFISRTTDKYSIFEYIEAWLIFMGIVSLAFVLITFISHYVFDEVNLIEDTKMKEKRKFTGSFADFLLRRHQTLCPICNGKRALISQKGKDGKLYYHCLACNQMFVENNKFNLFSISYLLLMAGILFILSKYIEVIWLVILFTFVFFLYYVIIWLLYKYKNIEFYHQMSAAERNKKVL